MSYYTKLKTFYKQVKGRFPEKLPTGVAALEAFVDDLRTTYPMPTEDRDSIVFSVSSMVMHLGPLEDRKPKYFFYRALRAGAAKQVAAYRFTQIKENQQALQRAQAAEPKKAEATASALTVASNEQKH